MITLTFSDFLLRSLTLSAAAWVILKSWPQNIDRRWRESFALGALGLLGLMTLGLVVGLPRIPIPTVSAHFPIASISRSGSISTLLIVVWLIGMAAALALEIVAHYRLNQLLRRTHRLESREWRAALAAAQQQLGIRGTVELRISERFGPAATGIVRRIVILSASALSWSAEMQRSILLHELAHFRRHDLFLQRLSRFIAILQWFNPFAHLLRNEVEAERESACDYIAAQLGSGPRQYAKNLIACAANESDRMAPAGAVTWLPVRRSLLERRIRHLLRAPRTPNRFRRILEALCATGAFVFLTACSLFNPMQSGKDWNSKEIEMRLTANPFPGNRP